MSIYDRDWYRGEQKSPYTEDNRKVSGEGAEKIRRMMEGASPNEPPKVDSKYRFEFVDSPTGNSKHSSNSGYDPTYGCGYQSSTVKQDDRYRNRRPRMKPLSFIVLAVVVGYVIAVGYNVISINNKLNAEFLSRNGLMISIEVGSRLGLVQSLGIIGNVLSNSADTSSVWQDSRFLREAVNVLYDWYAPIKWSPVLGVSKELGLFFINNRLNNTNRVNAPYSNDYGYAYVKSDALNVRSGPSANNRVVITLRVNSRVQIIDKTGIWWKIMYENIEGYVNSEYLSDEIVQVKETTRSEVRGVPQEINDQKAVLFSTSYNMGTTRSAQYQREWEEAYDRAPPVIPSGLVLPSGETVQERIDSGRVYGK
jgi:uncharacterized protein YraI